MRLSSWHIYRKPLRLWRPGIYREEWGTRYWRYICSLDDNKLFAARNIVLREVHARKENS